MRSQETVTPLELFFDLVFVLALTQCTALMAADPSWEGIAQAMLVLAVLWWSWGGYAWLTSTIDPEEGSARIAFFAAMAAFLVAALCVPTAFAENGLVFAGAYAVVRISHIALFLIASQDDPGLRRSVWGLAASTAIGVALLAVASTADGELQLAIWVLAILIDFGGPFLFGSEGWTIVAEHFSERYGLILIIALGESIVAVGTGADFEISFGVVVAAVLAIAVTAAQWWTYFDVTSYAATRHLASLGPGRKQNELARDAYGYLHLLLVAGVILVALGYKKTLGHVEDPLKIETSAAMLGGAAMYLFGQVAIRWRHVGSTATRRLVVAAICLALIPLGTEIPSIATLAILTALMSLLIVYEAVRYAEARQQIRSELAKAH